MHDARRASLERAVRGEVLGPGDALDRLGHDESHVRTGAWAAVRPTDVGDVVRLVRWARRHHVPLVPRGAGTSLDGESTALDGVVVDLARWNRIGPVDRAGRTVRVGPGVVNFDLQRRLRAEGLFYPPNPGSWATSTIGGNVGTNASGPRSFRYGPTRRWVRSLDAVLGTGERIHLGTRAEKRSLGPDLLHLMIGSEGTLGIVTSVTLRLAPLPARREGWAVPVPAGARLGRIAQHLSGAPGTGLSAVEYLDSESARGLAVRRGAGWTERGPLLLLEVESSGRAEAEAQRARLRSTLRRSGLTAPPQVFADADRLWTLRGEASRVLDERYGPRVREDVAVPLDRVDELIAALRTIGRRNHARLFLFAHLGEGSLHPNYEVDPGSPRAGRIRAAVCHAAVRLGGTISGEHGIGRLKRPFVARELGAPAVRLLRAVRVACDPDGILNPGKLYP